MTRRRPDPKVRVKENWVRGWKEGEWEGSTRLREQESRSGTSYTSVLGDPCTVPAVPVVVRDRQTVSPGPEFVGGG